MPRIDFRSEQTERGNDLHCAAICHRDEAGLWPCIHRRHSRVIGRIDFNHAGFFDNDLRLVIAHRGNLVGQGIPLFLRGENTDCMTRPEFMTHDRDNRTTTPVVVEGIVGWSEIFGGDIGSGWDLQSQSVFGTYSPKDAAGPDARGSYFGRVVQNITHLML